MRKQSATREILSLRDKILSTRPANPDYDVDRVVARLDEALQVITGTAIEGDLASSGGGGNPC